MSKQCDIVRDILPLYVDGACSEASAEMVKEHLNACADCNAIYQKLLSHTSEPLTKDDIRAEAARILSAFQAARGPNSPSGTHFMVQVSPDFLARANSKNQNRLVSMLPFRSLSISTLEGRKGVYALITKDEDRAQSLRLRKPSVRKKLSETKAEPGHTDKKKVREQER